MVAYIYQNMLKTATSQGIKVGSREAVKWFRETARTTKVQVPKLFEDRSNLRNRLQPTKDIGRMFMFHYDPKLKEKLPYYDRLPLIIVVDFTPDGFYGLNLHYLPPLLRAKLMDSLYETMYVDKYDNTKRLRLTYNMLKGVSRYRYFAPCFKKYLVNHVTSRFLYVEPEHWDKALMLPTERFTKATADQVYADSRSMF